jgi:Predicted secreted hydrolase
MHRKQKRHHISALALAAVVAVLSTGLASCASAPASKSEASPRPGEELRVLSTDADFERLGLERDSIGAWEDGRRSPQDGRHYEWWYFDGLLDDGTVVVAWIGDNWGYGSGTRNVSLEITPPDGKTRRFYKAYRQKGRYATSQADVRVATHSFSGDLGSYHVVIDPLESEGSSLGLDLVLKSRLPPYRPATGYVAAGCPGVDERYFAWLVAVPEGEVSGSLTVDGATRSVSGSGYHDHNWGNASPADLMDDWWWGRAVVGDRTVIASELRGKKELGGARIPLYYVASSAGREVDAYESSAARVEEGPSSRHPDPSHKRPIGSSMSFTSSGGIKAVFNISDRLVDSTDFVASQNLFVKAAAALSGMRPWYSRFASPVELIRPDAAVERGEGTLEFIEFH